MAKKRKDAETQARKDANALRAAEEQRLNKLRKEGEKYNRVVSEATNAECNARNLSVGVANLADDAEAIQEVTSKVPGEIEEHQKAMEDMTSDDDDDEKWNRFVKDKKTLMQEKLGDARNAADEIAQLVSHLKEEKEKADSAKTEIVGILKKLKEFAEVHTQTPESAQSSAIDPATSLVAIKEFEKMAKVAEKKARDYSKKVNVPKQIALQSLKACNDAFNEFKKAHEKHQTAIAKKQAIETNKKAAQERADERKRKQEERDRIAKERADERKRKQDERNEIAKESLRRKEAKEAARELTRIEMLNLWKANHAEDEDAARSFSLFNAEKTQWLDERQEAAAGDADKLQEHMRSSGNRNRAIIDLVTNGSSLSTKIPMPYAKWQKRRKLWPWLTVVVVDEITRSAKGSTPVLDEIWEEIAYKAALDLQSGSLQVAAIMSMEEKANFIRDEFNGKNSGGRVEYFSKTMKELISASFPPSTTDVKNAEDWLRNASSACTVVPGTFYPTPKQS